MFVFSNIMFDFTGLVLVAILVRNLYTGDPCEGVGVCPRSQKFLGTALLPIVFCREQGKLY